MIKFRDLINSPPNADIQEFYELTLLDETKSIQQKTVETLQIASKWEQEATLKFAGEAALVSKGKKEHKGYIVMDHSDRYYY